MMRDHSTQFEFNRSNTQVERHVSPNKMHRECEQITIDANLRRITCCITACNKQIQVIRLARTALINSTRMVVDRQKKIDNHTTSLVEAVHYLEQYENELRVAILSAQTPMVFSHPSTPLHVAHVRQSISPQASSPTWVTTMGAPPPFRTGENEKVNTNNSGSMRRQRDD
jgi:hypothetical protein